MSYNQLTHHIAGRYNTSPGSNVTRRGFAKADTSVEFLSASSGSHVANGTGWESGSRRRAKPSPCRTYVAGRTGLSLTQAWNSGGSKTKCFLPTICTKMFSKLSLCKAVVDLEFPIHRLMASGSFSRAMRAKGMSFWASEYRAKYSSRRLSFSYDKIC